MIKIRIELIFWSLVLIFLAGVSSNLGLSLMMLAPFQNPLIYFGLFALSMSTGFIWLPEKIIQKAQLGYERLTNEVRASDWKGYVITFLAMLLLNHFYFQGKEFGYQIVIATCEEVLFRFIIYNLLRREFSELWSMMIGSLLFAILLHINYDLADNLLIRFPIGIILSLLARYKGLHTSIFTHWLINMVAAKLI